MTAAVAPATSPAVWRLVVPGIVRTRPGGLTVVVTDLSHEEGS